MRDGAAGGAVGTGERGAFSALGQPALHQQLEHLFEKSLQLDTATILLEMTLYIS